MDSRIIKLTILFFVTTPLFILSQTKDIEKKVEDLLSKMTIEEKIGQTQQMTIHSKDLPAKLKDRIIKNGTGSFLNVPGAKNKNVIQKIAIEESRLGIPILYGRDVIHGFRTVVPIPIGQAASWNEELIEKAARNAAIEASSEGYRWTFAPMMDMTRDPRWGRIAETCGEDPLLTARLSSAMVRGFQGNNLADPTSIAACAKHYVAYGAAEGGRDYNTTEVSERTLRSYYLPPFKMAVENKAQTFMSAFNDLNGIPASGNKFTIKDILKNEWKFDGFVVSDWASITEMIFHGYCKDKKEAALKAFSAGVDMEMVTTSFYENLKGLIESGKIDEKILDEAVRRILRVKFRLGLFENPYTNEDAESPIFSEKIKNDAYELTAESIVLLKNKNDVLPLSKDIKSLAVIGPLADDGKNQLGCWAPDGRESESITPLTSLKEFLSDSKINYAKGVESCRSIDKDNFDDAIEAANKSDAVVVIIGEDARLSGEAHSRAFLNVPGVQNELIAELKKTGKPIIVVIMAGRPLVFDEITNNSDAVLYAWHPGTMAGKAITDLLFGIKIPSAKLPASFPRTVGQIPIYYNHKNTGRPANENMLGIEMGTPEDPKGFASNYIDVDFTPRYPFGFGLSYTQFEYSDLKLSSNKITKDSPLKVEAKITNTGNYDGKEIVQLYIQDKFGSVTRPVKELKDFQKIFLKAGESKIVKFTISQEDLAFWNIDMEFVSEPGEFNIWVGSNSTEGLSSQFILE